MDHISFSIIKNWQGPSVKTTAELIDSSETAELKKHIHIYIYLKTIAKISTVGCVQNLYPKIALMKPDGKLKKKNYF